MKIDFDAKRAFLNNRRLGEYSRDLISCVNKKHQLVLFTTESRKINTWSNNKKTSTRVLPKYNNYL